MPTTRPIIRAGIAGALLLAGSCGDTGPLNQVVLIIDTELCEAGDGMPVEFERIDVTVTVGDFEETFCATVSTDVEGCVRTTEFPLVLPLVSESGVGTANVSVSALAADESVAGCGRGSINFVAEQTLWASMRIPRACGAPDCGADILVPEPSIEGLGDLPAAIVCAPPSIDPVAPIRRLAAGTNHACLVDANGNIFCWGDNASGQLGTGDLSDRTRPTLVASLSDRIVEDIECGQAHTCAVVAMGASRNLFCWGANDEGQVGNGNRTQVLTPASIGGTVGVRRVSLGPQHTCATFSDQTVKCWGANAAGESSGAAGDALLAATVVAGVTVATSGGVTAGGSNGPSNVTSRHSCVMADAAGTPAVSCWGGNGAGQLGAPDASETGPVAVSGLPPVNQVAVQGRQSCAVAAADGRLWCWGQNQEPGTLGFPLATGLEGREMAEQLPFPDQVLAPPAAEDDGPALATLAMGDNYRCFINGAGGARCLGENIVGRLGSGVPVATSPVDVESLGATTFKSIVAGGSFVCALPDDGALPFCWGDNSSGQLGRGTSGGSFSARQLESCGF